MSKRRVVLIDQNETPDYSKYFGCGLGNEIYTTQALDALSEVERRQKIATLGPGDAIMSVGGGPFKYLKQYYHFGVRNENYSDCAKLTRLSLEGGAFLKQVLDFPGDSEIKFFLSPEFTRPAKFPEFKQDLISDLPGAMRYIDCLDSLPLDQHFGFDYEASGMPLDKEFWISGAAIVTESFGAFISFTDIRRTLGGEDNPGYQGLLRRLGEFLVKRQDHIWVYNMQYEWLVSHRVLGVDLYNLCDASVVNVMDGYHFQKKYSLKWTAQRVLGVTVWDTEFDRISDLLDQMYYTVEGKLKRDKKKVLKVTMSDFNSTPEWKELARRYPNDIQEMEQLVHEYWGMPFMAPSSRLLGIYCCLDSFYTLMIAKKRLPRYSQDCWQVNLDNTRLGARLMGSGLYIDEPYREKYERYCEEMQVWAITYCAQARCYIKMEKHKNLGADITTYNKTAQKLIKSGKFFNGDPVEIVKDIMLTHLDNMDSYDTGLNEGLLMLDFGQEFAEAFVDVVKSAMSEVKMKTKIDDSIKRKKKILGIIAENSKSLLGIGRINKTKLVELEKYMYYKTAYDELDKVSKLQLPDIHNIPETLHYRGQELGRLEYANFISDEYFKCKSPIENDKIALEFTNLFKAQTAFLTGLLESTQQLPEATEFYSTRGITDIQKGYLEFMDHWKKYVIEKTESGLYPNKIFDLALQYFQKPEEEKVKETWTNFNGYSAQSRFFPQYNKQFPEYEKHFDPSDFDDVFFFMRKLVLNYLTFKKYAKLQSTYVGSDGMFHKTGKWVIEGPDHIPLRDADEGEPGAVWKVFVHYEVNTKSSKRWSSPFHTIISHSDCKDALCPPPSWDENGNIIYGGSNQILTYFDISSAEVKAAGYASGDPDLIKKFNSGEDIYIYSAQLYLGEDGWKKLSKKAKKKWRKRFKTVFLGVLYGLGKNSLAERLECSLEESDRIIQGLYNSFPKLREYVSRQSEYPMNNNGYVNTMLGDKLQVVEYTDYLPKAKTSRERNNLIARIGRLGVNLPIQGGTSSIMACGFFNNIRESINEKYLPGSPFSQHALQPIIVVHDSNTNYVPVDAIFGIKGFYDKNYTEYCHGIGPGIYLLFDLLVGYSYELANTLVQIDPNTVEFTGSALSVLKLYDKIMQCSFPVSSSMGREEIERSIDYCRDPYDRFIREEGCSMVKDLSSITVRFHKE